MPLKFLKEPSKTKMFCKMGDEAKKSFKGNFTMHAHSESLRPEKIKKDKGLKSFWDVTSVSLNNDGEEFVSTLEAKKYPIMTTVFHPEMVTQSDTLSDSLKAKVNASQQAVELNKYFADTFIRMAKANPNS